jgi:hypothetical protein
MRQDSPFSFPPITGMQLPFSIDLIESCNSWISDFLTDQGLVFLKKLLKPRVIALKNPTRGAAPATENNIKLSIYYTNNCFTVSNFRNSIIDF